VEALGFSKIWLVSRGLTVKKIVGDLKLNMSISGDAPSTKSRVYNALKASGEKYQRSDLRSVMLLSRW
jgi:hypothetical protein